MLLRHSNDPVRGLQRVRQGFFAYYEFARFQSVHDYALVQDRGRAYGDDIDIASIEQAAIVAGGEWNGILISSLLQPGFVDIGNREQLGAPSKRVAGYGVLFKDSSRTDNSDSHSIHVVPPKQTDS